MKLPNDDFEELVAEYGKSQALKALDEALSKRVEFELADEKMVNGKRAWLMLQCRIFPCIFLSLKGVNSPYDWLATEATKQKWYGWARILGAEKTKHLSKRRRNHHSQRSSEKSIFRRRFADIRNSVFFDRKMQTAQFNALI